MSPVRHAPIRGINHWWLLWATIKSGNDYSLILLPTASPPAHHPWHWRFTPPKANIESSPVLDTSRIKTAYWGGHKFAQPDRKCPKPGMIQFCFEQQNWKFGTFWRVHESDYSRTGHLLSVAVTEVAVDDLLCDWLCIAYIHCLSSRLRIII